LAYFVTPARVWELLLGAIIAFLPLLKNYDLRLMLPWLGLAMISYALLKWNGDNFPGWHALVPTLGTALIIYAGAMVGESRWSFEHMLRFKPIQWIGDLSYSLYLWHWPLIILLPVLLFFDLDSHPQSLLIKLGIFVLSIGIAQLSFKYIEQRALQLKPKKRYIYVSFFIIVATIAGAGYFISHQVESNTQKSIKDIRTIVLDDTDNCTGAKSIINECGKSYGYIQGKYEQIGSNDKYDYLLSAEKYCSSYDAKKYSPNTERYCIVGDLDSKNEITIWGDSHTQHWINPMDKIGQENNVKINIIGTSSCFGSSQYQENCDMRFENIKSTGVLDRSDAIIVSMWHSEYNNSKGNNIVSALGVLNSISNNTNTYLLEDVPVSGNEGGPNCSVLRQSCINNIKDATGPITKDSSDIVDLGLISANHIIPVKDMFCDADYCFSNIGGIPVYRDKNIGTNKEAINSHLTASFAYSTWPALELKLKNIGILE
jgi:hypothetical protein